ncbi:S-adenosylmethionine-dependent methyltransferase [Neofusicoccum ribis]|uniref:S-adenosylmethionine-dependent methyltransferase n=1 Tax=Neofusicoccum ribis TaxID=45134 RepID=A0ABR3SCV8_9PEZI
MAPSEPPKRFVLPLLPHGPGTDSPLDEEDGQDLETPLGSLAPLLESHLGRDAYDSISIVNLSTSISPLGTPSTAQPTNPLRAAFRSALTTLPPEALDHLSLTPDLLAAALPATYSIYPPLLLLPAHTFRHPSWTALLTTHPLTSPTTRTLLTHVATTLHVTHIALNAPIALTTPHPNILRAPTSLTPLHGPWPPLAAAPPAPALWASARQNGINQTWAPAYTMFSRGNVKEKARLLALPSVAAAAAGGCAAVDLYAGIGYFAFSYRRAGVATC